MTEWQITFPSMGKQSPSLTLQTVGKPTLEYDEWSTWHPQGLQCCVSGPLNWLPLEVAADDVSKLDKFLRTHCRAGLLPIWMKSTPDAGYQCVIDDASGHVTGAWVSEKATHIFFLHARMESVKTRPPKLKVTKIRSREASDQRT